jgi:O-antigen/teichoic acid export membrane protein
LTASGRLPETAAAQDLFAGSESSASGPQESASLKRNVLSAVGWAAATRFLAQLINWSMTLIVIRFLEPADYGLMAVTMAVAGFLQSMSSVGIADAIVQKRDLGGEDLRAVFGLVILVNGGLMAALALLAYPVATFYEEPRLVALLQVVSLSFIAIGLSAIPRAILDKRLDLKRVSRVELAANVVSGVSVLALAASGEGVWSLMIGNMINAVLRAAGFFVLAPYWEVPSFRFATIGEVLRNGGLRTSEQALWYIYNSADVFIIGKILGPELLGIYSVGRQIAALPVEKLATVVKPVAFPAFAMVQDRPQEAFRYLQKAMRLLGLVSFPVFFGISVLAPEIVEIVLGPRWAAAELPLQLLAVGMALRPVGLVLPSFLMGIGEFRASFNNTLFGTVLFPLAFVMGSGWGLPGVCIAGLLAYPVQFMVLVRRIALVMRRPMTALVGPVAKPLLGAVIMYVGVLALGHVVPDEPAWAKSLLLVAAGVVVYGSYILIFCRALSLELLVLARR